MSITAVHKLIFEIESGARTIVPREHPDEVWAGNVTYDVEGGWVIVIFNDCCSFDYIDSIIEPDGFVWTYDDVPFFGQYDPPEDVIRVIYKIGEDR